MKEKVNAFDFILYAFTILWGLMIVYPFYNAALVSIVTQAEYIKTPFMLWPKQITFAAYKYLFNGNAIFYGYRNTLLIVFIGVPFNMILTTSIAYALSRPAFPGKKAITMLVVFTMYFGGGMVPHYLLVKNLGLTDSLFSVILTSGVVTYYMIITRKFFDTIPESLIESARIDGANEIVILFRIMLPLSKPILATLVLFFTVSRWNGWFDAMLFLRSAEKWPLQLILRSIIYSSIAETGGEIEQGTHLFTDGVKMASIIVTMLPIMLFYPLLQKYFVKGLLIGAVKA